MKTNFCLFENFFVWGFGGNFLAIFLKISSSWEQFFNFCDLFEIFFVLGAILVIFFENLFVRGKIFLFENLSNILNFSHIFQRFFVTIPILGFLSLGNEVLPGNLGLWDQALAFKWLHENVEAFGGDPWRITATGLSAGAASVAALSLSPHSRSDFFVVEKIWD